MAQQSESKSGAVTVVSDVSSFESALAQTPFAVLFFWADWHDPCTQMQSVITELAADHTHLTFFSIDAGNDDLGDLSLQFDVAAVPTIILKREGDAQPRSLVAESVPNTVAAINQFAKHAQTALALSANDAPKQQSKGDSKAQNGATEQSESTEQLNARITKIISAAPIMLFMKGSPDDPKCKFSRETIAVLKSANVLKFGYFNILNDAAVRAGLKEYSSWKTFPQLYVQGAFVGGLDVIKELIEDGEFEALLPRKLSLNERLKALVQQKRVMLFLKGCPEAPQCGFSNQMVRILKEQGVSDYGSFDILSDNEVRQGLKVFSNWPTFPQLYVKGQLIGGLDVVKEMIEDDEFQEAVAVAV